MIDSIHFNICGPFSDLHNHRKRMPEPLFILVDPVTHYDAFMGLNSEYMSWVHSEMERWFGVAAHDDAGTTAPDHGACVIHQICAEQAQKGVFYLIMVDDRVAGMCGLRFARSGVAEVKRMYVRPQYRGMHLGQQALRRILADACRRGYGGICLDTAPFMKTAHRLYEAHGFADCPAYEGTEVPLEFRAGWRFMYRPITNTHAGCRP